MAQDISKKETTGNYGITKKMTIKKIIQMLTYKDGKYWTMLIKTNGNFLWRLWFLISAPIIWLIKGEIKIK